jgi:bifunctional UDP-N-acetylglucosamine pyrophosphorylase/glucosamine-1-phosphate N-acetyltransferase
MNDNLTVVILAAGLGTRMKSRKAKVLHEAGGMTLIEHVVRSASALTAPERIVVVVGHQAERVEAQLAASGVRFARQTEQHGTAHAVMMAEEAVGNRGGRVVVLYGDGPLLSAETLRKLLEHHGGVKAAASLITTELDNAYGYGRVITDEDGFVRHIVEEKAATAEQKKVRVINSGIYCFEGAALWDTLHRLTPNPASGEYYLTDVVDLLNAAGRRVSSMKHADAAELLGINSRVELAEVDAIFRMRKARELMLAGVTIVKPETVLIDVDVEAGMDSVIEPYVQLLGKTKIGEECRIGAGSVLRDSTLADRVELAPYTLVNASTIESGATVGPFARLRMDNRVGANAHIGNFVELKKTDFRAGAKAGHLAYLGDSTIGEEVNIGAGTITCNYDGRAKHRTEIGAGVFVGSNSTLVAPVELERGSFIAAGSVITDKVPADALGIGRGKQVNKEGWAVKRRSEKTSTASSGSSSADAR